MPENYHRRRGAVGLLIVAISVFLMLILPLLTAGLRFNVSRIRHAICRDILAASMPSAYLAVSSDELSLGRLTIDQQAAIRQILNQVQKNQILAGIEADLCTFSVMFGSVDRPEPADHWLSRTRPDEMPVITAQAAWRFTDGLTYTVRDSIELILD